MANYERHAISHKLFCGGHRLLRVTEVVNRHRKQPLTQDAASVIQVLNRGLHAGSRFFASPGSRPGQRRGKADPNFGPSCQVGDKANGESGKASHKPTPHPRGPTVPP